MNGSKSIKNKFLDLELGYHNVDNFYIRTSIQKALDRYLWVFSGKLLDVGCGEMPYREYVLSKSRVVEYVGCDIDNPTYQKDNKPDIFWNGNKIPLDDASIDCVIATELFEHIPDIDSVLKELNRVLKPNGALFFTVPFLWPLHDIPYDEYRYTPFALKRIFEGAGYTNITINSLGGWDAALATMLGLWLKRSPMSNEDRKKYMEEFFPFYQTLIEQSFSKSDLKYEDMISQSIMITGLYGVIYKHTHS